MVGKFNKVPIIIGTVSEDARLFIYRASSSALSDAVRRYFIGVKLSFRICIFSL